MANKMRHIDYNFTGGLNVDASPDHLSDGELRIADNVILLPRGGIRKRHGHGVLFEDPDNAMITQIIEWQSIDATRFLYIGNNILRLVSGPNSAVNIQALQKDVVPYFFFQDKLYIIDENSMYSVEFDADNIPFVKEVPITYERQMLPAPNDPPTITSSPMTGGYPPGVWQFAFVQTNLEGDIVSSISPDSTETNISQESIVTITCDSEGSFIHAYAMLTRLVYVVEVWGDGGTFTLQVGANETADIAHDANQIELQDAINTANLFTENVTATVRHLEPSIFAYTIFFDPTEPVLEPPPAMTADVSTLTYTQGDATVDIHVSPDDWEDFDMQTHYRLKKDTPYGHGHFEYGEGPDPLIINTHLTGRRENPIPYVADSTIVLDSHPIENSQFAVRHARSYRFFYAGNSEHPNTLFYSEPNQPDVTTEASRLVPTTNDGPITGLAVLMDAVLVFYRNSIWTYRGIDPNVDGRWEKLPTSISTISNSSIQLTTESLTLLSQSGLHALSPNILQGSLALHVGDTLIRDISQDKVSSSLKRLVGPQHTKAAYDPINKRYFLHYLKSTPAGNIPELLVYDFTLHCFSTWSIFDVDDIIYSHAFNGLMGALNNTLILFTDDERDDDSPLHILTKQYHLDYPFNRKKLQRLYIALENPMTDGYELEVTLYADDNEALYETVVIDPGNALVTLRLNTYAMGTRFQVDIRESDTCPPVTGTVQPTIYGLAFDYSVIQDLANDRL